MNIVTVGNACKVTQNSRIARMLLSTSRKTLVEASPYDRVWGIGFDEIEAPMNVSFRLARDNAGLIVTADMDVLILTEIIPTSSSWPMSERRRPHFVASTEDNVDDRHVL